MAKIVQSKENNGFFRQLMFLSVLVATGVVLFIHLRFFVGAVLGAFTLYIVFRCYLFKMVEKWRWKPWVAALTLTSMCFLLLSGIGYVTFRVIAAEMPDVDASGLLQGVNGLIVKLDNAVGFKVIPENIMNESGGIIGQIAGAVFNTTYSLAANILMMLVIVYFMFAKGRRMEEYAYRYMPFRGKSMRLLRKEVKNIVYSNAIGIPLVMIGQVLTSGFVYWLAGMENFLFWGFLTAICGLVPLVGSALVFIPIAVYYAAEGDIWTGVMIASLGLLVVANVDNLIRIILMRKMSGTHPLIVIFGVILGVPLFGFWGIIFGPLFVAAFFLLIRIYYMEYDLENVPPGKKDCNTESVKDENAPGIE